MSKLTQPSPFILLFKSCLLIPYSKLGGVERQRSHTRDKKGSFISDESSLENVALDQGQDGLLKLQPSS